MTDELTNIEKKRGLPWICYSEAMSVIFCNLTVFGSIFILFLNELGLDKTKIGFLLSLFPFCGVLALFVAPAIARRGFKRTFITFFGIRKGIIAFLLLTPWIVSKFGISVAFKWVTCIIFIFAICRAIAETAVYPWYQEIIPDSIRGKFGSVVNILATITGMASLGLAGHIIGKGSGLGRFMIVIAIGVVAGIIGVVCSFFIPGGAPIKEGEKKSDWLRKIRRLFQDKNYLLFLAGLGLVTVAIAGIVPFIPLFMKEQVGLSPRNIILLGVWGTLGNVLSNFLWGWSADRYGSKPVMQTGLWLVLFLPVAWLLIPRHSALSYPVAVIISFLFGLSIVGWTKGWGRYFYVTAVPKEKKTEYMAIFYAWLGIVGGGSILLFGRLIDIFKGIQGKIFMFTIDAYTPLFTISFLLVAIALMVLNQIRPDGALPFRKFVRLFLQGNSFTALGTTLKYRLANGEPARILTTEQMGTVKHPLNLQELMESLSDPSYNVRYEAIISSARMQPDTILVNKLLQIVAEKETELSTVAIWALGKINDKSAIPPLRKILLSGNPLFQASSARALANLDDYQSVPVLLERLQSEGEDCFRIAYASALGILKEKEAIEGLLNFIRETENETIRSEIALSIARIVGNERYYIRLWRKTQDDINTSFSEAVLQLKKMLFSRKDKFAIFAKDCADKFAQGDLKQGCIELQKIIQVVNNEISDEVLQKILGECNKCFAIWNETRTEYILLSLHAMNSALRS